MIGHPQHQASPRFSVCLGHMCSVTPETLPWPTIQVLEIGCINREGWSVMKWGAMLQTDFKGMVATWAPKNFNILAHT